MAPTREEVIQRLHATAIHEAGHAVTAYILGREFTGVTIVPASDYLGLCTFSPFPPNFQPDMHDAYDEDDPTLQLLEQSIICTMAGGIAEERSTGAYNQAGCESDLDAAMRISLYATGDPDGLQGYWDAAWARAEALVREHWRAIEAVADALLQQGTLTAEQAVAVISARR